MKKHIKILIIISVISIFIGAALMLGALLALRNNASSVVTGLEFKESVYTITDPFTNINIHTINSSIELLPSPDGICRIVCSDSKKLYHQVSVTESSSGSQLNISQCEDWQWFEMLYDLYRKDALSLLIYLPETEYTLLHADSSSGNITIAPDFRFQTVNTYTSSGNTKITTLDAETLSVCSLSGDLIVDDLEATQDIYLESISGSKQIGNLTAVNVTVHGSSGHTFLENITADTLHATSGSEDFLMTGSNFRNITYFETSNGSIEILDSNCGEQSLQTVSGNITLQKVNGNSLNIRTGSGAILIENALYNSNLLCTTTSGEILFSDLDAGTLELISSSGNISGNLLSAKNFITGSSSGFTDIPPADETAGTCHIRTASGNINVAIKP